MAISCSASWSLVVAGSWASVVVVLGACLDAPVAGGAPVARVVAGWDPLACGEPHRVVLELALDPGLDPAEGGRAMASASAPCNLGGLSLDVPQLGIYRGRIYAWALAAPIRSITAVELEVDRAVVDWFVATPR
jgi:hypothetical protein